MEHPAKWHTRGGRATEAEAARSVAEDGWPGCAGTSAASGACELATCAQSGSRLSATMMARRNVAAFAVRPPVLAASRATRDDSPAEVQLLVLPPPAADGVAARVSVTMTINQLAGILPAVVFPAATLVQLARMMRQRSAVGVSVSTWLLFGFANLGIYFYAERYTEWQAIVGMLLTAVLDFVIVVLAVWVYRPARAAEPRESALSSLVTRRV